MAAVQDPFEIFCWYYLGLSPGGEYKFVNGNQVAQHYNCSVDDLMAYLKKHRMDPNTVVNTDFPLARYQIDVQLMAEKIGGDACREFASRIFEEFQSKIGTSRDWLAEIEREREEDKSRRQR